MSKLSKEIEDIALAGLEMIGDIAEQHGGSKGEVAAQALAAVSAIVKSIRAGHDRTATPDEVIAQINRASDDFDAQLEAHKKTGQDLLDHKFGKKTESAPPTAG